MTKTEIDKLLQLREFVIKEYKQLDGSSAPATAVMKQEDAALTYESVIRSIEDLLSETIDFN